ncbi:hypothetical protein BRADI_3g47445v3, partial [Brachypodium distachyon]
MAIEVPSLPMSEEEEEIRSMVDEGIVDPEVDRTCGPCSRTSPGHWSCTWRSSPRWRISTGWTAARTTASASATGWWRTRSTSGTARPCSKTGGEYPMRRGRAAGVRAAEPGRVVRRTARGGGRAGGRRAAHAGQIPEGDGADEGSARGGAARHRGGVRLPGVPGQGAGRRRGPRGRRGEGRIHGRGGQGGPR